MKPTEPPRNPETCTSEKKKTDAPQIIGAKGHSFEVDWCLGNDGLMG